MSKNLAYKIRHCAGNKNKYASQADANAAKEKYLKAHKTVLYTYRCKSFCKALHLTRKVIA